MSTNPFHLLIKFLPTISHERDISISSSSALDSSVLNTPIRLPSSLNLRVIARVSTSSVQNETASSAKERSVVMHNLELTMPRYF